MRRLGRLDDRDIDRLLAGDAPADHEELEELAMFLRAVRVRLDAPPAPEVEARHLRAVSREVSGGARRSTRSTAARRPRILRFGARLAAAVVALVLSTTGLAVAGVELPEAAEKVFGRFGVTLPNQDANGTGGDAEKPRPSDGGRGEPTGDDRPDTATPDQATGGRLQSDGAGVPAPREEGATGGAGGAGIEAPAGVGESPGGARQGAERGQEGARTGAERRAEGIGRGQEGARLGAERRAEGIQRGQEQSARGRARAEQAPSGPPQGTPPAGEVEPGPPPGVPGDGDGPPFGGPPVGQTP
jgi:hypothetical protein